MEFFFNEGDKEAGKANVGISQSLDIIFAALRRQHQSKRYSNHNGKIINCEIFFLPLSSELNFLRAPWWYYNLFIVFMLKQRNGFSRM